VRDRESIYDLRYGKRCDMGIIGMLEFHRMLARLVEIYVAPVERDYLAY
jgi:hypothetical protein